MSFEQAILGLHAHTQVHAGAGREVGVVDLPVQREAHTNWPCIYGSAMKGAMRSRAADVSAPWLIEVFGPEAGSPAVSEHSGALCVSDARLLLLPVRSLTTAFKWVTCPSALRRLARDTARCRRPAINVSQVPVLQDKEKALVHTGQPSGNLFLEELRFDAVPMDLTVLCNAIAPFLDPNADPLKQLEQQLTIVHDDRFGSLASTALPVAAHVRLDHETKTVDGGALWYEETLPPETILYSELLATASRRDQSQLTAADVMKHATLDLFPPDAPYLQVGGNETLGMGWCRVQILRPAARSAP